MKADISNLQRKIRLNKGSIAKDTLKLLRELRLQRAELSVTFIGPARMRALNLKWRGIDRPTDVLSFPIFSSPKEFPKDSDFLLGDIFICPARAEGQRKEHGLTLKEEIRWLIVHGLLHLIGYEHEGDEKEARRMRRKEGELLCKL